MFKTKATTVDGILASFYDSLDQLEQLIHNRSVKVTKLNEDIAQAHLEISSHSYEIGQATKAAEKIKDFLS